MAEPKKIGERDAPAELRRRSFLSATATGAMAGGLAASYGTLAFMAGRFLYPSRPPETTWSYVAAAIDLKPGVAIQYRIPTGELVTITRLDRASSVEADEDGKGAELTSEDFLALSTTCPHLGCKVKWEYHNNRFFCPCHNGVFTPEGVATEGPPADAGQSLPRYPLKVENGLLFIEVPVETLARSSGGDRRSRARGARGVVREEPDAGRGDASGRDSGSWC